MSDSPPRPKAPSIRVPATVRFAEAPAARPAQASVPSPSAARVPAAVVASQQRAAAAVRVSGGARIGPTQPEAKPAPAKRPTPPPFLPNQPRTWDALGVDPQVVIDLVLRFMHGTSAVSSRELSTALSLPLLMVREVMQHLKDENLVNHRSTTALGDFVSELTQAGLRRAEASRSITHYVGPCPVAWDHYLKSVEAQALSLWAPRQPELREAFSDLSISDDLLDRLGPALTSCRPIFLFGQPGNGKTSIAERITRCFGQTIWIPRALLIGRHVVKLFDPAIHREIENDPRVLAQARIDTRWVQIERPTVLAGGELTLDQLELQIDEVHNIHEAPLQLKANCGTFILDDFGRGNTSPKDLLNRWIFPLERGIDFLQLPDGRKFSLPFQCLLIFSTNLEPADLADEAFLRRIPYKVHIGDPDEQEFADLVELLAPKMGVHLTYNSVKYLIERHYKMPKRPMRFCHPRDLLLQVISLCEYQGRPSQAGPPEWDQVVSNYFCLA